MSKKSFYDILQVSQHASSQVISDSYKTLRAKYQAGADSGDQDAKNQLVLLLDAYFTLSSDDRRKRYDGQLRNTELNAYSGTSSAYSGSRPYIERPVSDAKWNFLNKFLLTFVVLALVYFAFSYYQSKQKQNSQKELAERVIQIQEERTEYAGKRVDNSIELSVKESNRKDKELEYRMKSAELDLELKKQQLAEREAAIEQQRLREQERIAAIESRKEQRQVAMEERERRLAAQREKQALCDIYYGNRRYAEAREAGCGR